MQLDEVRLGMSLRSWLALALLLSALLVVAGYIRHLVGASGQVLTWIGFLVAMVCLAVGAVPASKENPRT